MNIAIVYHSTRGTTAKAAEAMGKILREHSHQVSVESVMRADPAQVIQADLICIGTWVKGWFVIRQHPTFESMYFINQLGDLPGKKVIVFCTYKLAIGSTLRQMVDVLEEHGADVVGEFKYRSPVPDQTFKLFAAGLG
jgi:flavodoxin